MTDGWVYAGASVIGTSHLKTDGHSCQDSHRCLFVPEIGAFIGVVSDGAGSASRGAEGSQITCEVALRECANAKLSELFSRDFALSVLETIRLSIVNRALHDNLRERDFACTMLVAIISGGQVAFWQIGDGAIIFRIESEDRYRFAFWPAKGEYANITEFVTDLDAANNLNFDSGDLCIDNLALFSDGLERLALDFKEAEVHDPFFNGLFPHLYLQPPGRSPKIEEQLGAFLGSDRVNKCTDDDKTLILATRKRADGA